MTTQHLPQVQAIECQPRAGLPNVLAKLRAGETVRVAYFGGSITQAEGWRVQTHEWLAATYPSATVEMIHAAIGGTGSDLGAFRLDRDVLAHQPDLVFVEFAVNDSGMQPDSILRQMEGIVRKTWRWNPCCDICFVYTVTDEMTAILREGVCPSSSAADEQIAEHYGIPSVQLALEVARLEGEGKLIFTVPEGEKATVEAAGTIAFAGDACHPYVEGHRLYTAAIQRAFAQIAGVGSLGAHNMPAPLTADNWETARMLPIGNAEVLGNCRRLENDNWPPIAWSVESVDEVWLADKPGDGLLVRFHGTGIGINDVIGPDTGQLAVTVDGERRDPAIRFDPHCSYHRTSYFLAITDLPDGEHEVRFELLPGPPDKAAIMAVYNWTMDDPARFAENRWYPAALLILGEEVRKA